jgi:2-aminoadipate transaminase
MILFANRMQHLHKSFIREILKVTQNPEVISFAGGLPNPQFFPVQEITEASQKVLRQDGQNVLQYSTTEGYPPLREAIAGRYHRRFGLTVNPDEILITNGSQQGLDLLGKIFINSGDPVALERPGYLGAIQAFSLFEPHFQPVPLLEAGVDVEAVQHVFSSKPVKLFYSVPNFQNPSGISYSLQTRQDVAGLIETHNVLLVEDDPYGELRFAGEYLPSIKNFSADNVVMLGSFSKVVSPGLRLGWVCASPEIMEKLLVVKQATDLHSNYLAQRVVYQYLQDNDLDHHLAEINAAYKAQCNLMLEVIEECFPPEASVTHPEGGMFLWVTLPKGVSSMHLFEQAAKQNVAFVPGHPFYVDGGGDNTLRLNFSNSDEAKIEAGIRRLADAMKTLLTKL